MEVRRSLNPLPKNRRFLAKIEDKKAAMEEQKDQENESN